MDVFRLNEGLAVHRLEQETRCAGMQKENACPRYIQRISNISNEEYNWEMNAAFAPVPGGMSELQVPDVVENKPFKECL